MKTVILRGPVLTQSGYGVHTRQVARWLLSRDDVNLKIIATPWGDTPWIINDKDPLIKEIMKRTTHAQPGCDVSFQVQLPNEWENLATKNIGITAAVETDICNPEWINACNNMDEIVVPSQHAKLNLTNTGVITKPLHVIPESYSDALISQDLPELPQFKTPFNFLVFGQITGNNPNNDRKNVFFTIKWLCETFKNDPDVGVVIKTNCGRNSLIDKNVCTNLIQGAIREVRTGEFPKFYLVHGDMNDNEVAALYKHPQIKALISLTRGEGYGLPTLEAAASGLPIIATNWSGHLDFLKNGKFISVFYQLEEVHKTRIDNKIFMKGARWANPSEDDFKKRVMKFKTSPTTPAEWAVDMQKKIIDTYGFEQIRKIYDATFGDALK